MKVNVKCDCGWEWHGSIQAALKRKEQHQKTCKRAPRDGAFGLSREGK